MDLRGSGRHHHFTGPDVQHAGRGPGDHRRPGVDRDDLLAVGRVEEQDTALRLLGRGLGPLPARAATDDDHLDLGSLDGSLPRGRRQGHVRIGHGREWRHHVAWVAPNGQSGPGPNLAAPDVGDAIGLDETVAAIAGEAQGPALGRGFAGAQDRDRDRVIGLEGDRVAIDDDVAGFGWRHGALGHWRIRRPWGSNSGSGWSRAGRRRPMISTSNPLPPGPSEAASSAGT